jgi:hypothetical protein
LQKRILDAQCKLDERELVSAGCKVRAADTEKRLAMVLAQLAEMRAQSKAQEASWNKAEQEAYTVAAEVEELEQARVRLVVAQHELTSSMMETSHANGRDTGYTHTAGQEPTTNDADHTWGRGGGSDSGTFM